MGLQRRFLATGLLVLGVALVGAPRAFADSARAAELFQLCASCHGADGGGNRAFLAPAIAGMSEWAVATQLAKFRDGLRGTHFDDVSGMRMLAMSRWIPRDEDVQILASYVAGMPSTSPQERLSGGDPQRGETLYAPCAQCHGAQGEGVQDMRGGPLVHLDDWYLLEQLKKFKSGVRGSNPQDPFSIMMRPNAIALADEQAMKDVIAYILTLSEN